MESALLLRKMQSQGNLLLYAKAAELSKALALNASRL
jgi:hypothetical protein